MAITISERLSLTINVHSERCFLPIHIYDTAAGCPVTMILRPGRTPSGAEVRRWLRRLVKRIRRYWPETQITIRGDGHYGRDEAMNWCEENGIDYIFGLAGNCVLDRLVEVEADDIRTRRAEGKLAVLRGAVLADRDQTSVAGRRNPLRGQILDKGTPCGCTDRGERK